MILFGYLYLHLYLFDLNLDKDTGKEPETSAQHWFISQNFLIHYKLIFEIVTGYDLQSDFYSNMDVIWFPIYKNLLSIQTTCTKAPIISGRCFYLLRIKTCLVHYQIVTRPHNGASTFFFAANEERCFTFCTFFHLSCVNNGNVNGFLA